MCIRDRGYIYNNRNTFTEWYDGRDVPEEYRVTPQPPVQEKEQADLDAAAVQPAFATEQPPVLPIILSSEKPADKMKEITDRLEQGTVSYTHLLNRTAAVFFAQRQRRDKSCGYGDDCRHAPLLPACHV